MNPPPEAATVADLQRLYDKLDVLQRQQDGHEKDDLKVHGDFKAFMAGVDVKLDGVTDLIKKISWGVGAAVLTAVLNLVFHVGKP